MQIQIKLPYSSSGVSVRYRAEWSHGVAYRSVSSRKGSGSPLRSVESGTPKQVLPALLDGESGDADGVGHGAL
jgi:hypothetical protein